MGSLNPIEAAAESPYELLLRASLMIPISHYLLGFSLALILFLYNFLEYHFLQDLFTGFRGQPVVLTFSPSSEVYRDVVSKCRILHGRFKLFGIFDTVLDGFLLLCLILSLALLFFWVIFVLLKIGISQLHGYAVRIFRLYLFIISGIRPLSIIEGDV